MLAADGIYSYTKAYQRIVSRREAFATAQPNSLVVLGDADSFVYSEGVLCWIQNHTVRIIDIHNDVGTQFVSVLPDMWEGAVKEFGASEEHNRLVHIIPFPGGKILLQISEFEARIRAITRISPEDSKILKPSHGPNFLRVSNWFRTWQDFIVCGNHTGIGANSHHEWVIQVFSQPGTEGMTLNADPIQLERFFGIDVGQTIVFEIFDGYFYAVSNTSSPEVEEIDWTSYYHCYRFPLHNAKQETLQYTQIWRRQHREGPINDSWTSLSLQKDEGTGKVTICEARREWKNGSSVQERNFYLQTLEFEDSIDPVRNDEETGNGEEFQDLQNLIEHPDCSSRSDLSNIPGPLQISDPSDTLRPTNSAYPPNDVLVTAIDETNKPLYEPPRYRPPRGCHPESPASARTSLSKPPKTYILTNTKHRSYNLASSAFLDVVTEDSKRAFNTAQISLRIGARSLDSPIDIETTGRLREPLVDESTGSPLPGSEERFRDRGIHLWPPLNVAPSELLEVLQIKGASRKVEAVTDERSIILAIGGGGGGGRTAKKLVLVNFDPAIRFPGLEEITLPRNDTAGDASFGDVVLQSTKWHQQNRDNHNPNNSASRDKDGKGKKRAHPEIVMDADEGDSGSGSGSDTDQDIITAREKRAKSESRGHHDEIMVDDDVAITTTAPAAAPPTWKNKKDSKQQGQWTSEPAEWKRIGKGWHFIYR